MLTQDKKDGESGNPTKASLPSTLSHKENSSRISWKNVDGVLVLVTGSIATGSALWGLQGSFVGLLLGVVLGWYYLSSSK
jgi:hypothetical protein